MERRVGNPDEVGFKMKKESRKKNNGVQLNGNQTPDEQVEHLLPSRITCGDPGGSPDAGMGDDVYDLPNPTIRRSVIPLDVCDL